MSYMGIKVGGPRSLSCVEEKKWISHTSSAAIIAKVDTELEDIDTISVDEESEDPLMLLCVNIRNQLAADVNGSRGTKIELLYLTVLALETDCMCMRNTAKHSEAGELPELLIQGLSGYVVTQADGAEGDEAEVKGLQEVPVLLQR
ncbi:hypothetical protein EYF80_027975 [Liparis tanakae]|uniref:Uncharacterized protein n=1 Tax=Liparis tanakae TaxID=230148 RepID=A0A4Z2H9P7_9TELE|nr:hypothetical protein EYF80_027975 [Liparis tanakae]